MWLGESGMQDYTIIWDEDVCRNVSVLGNDHNNIMVSCNLASYERVDGKW